MARKNVLQLLLLHVLIRVLQWLQHARCSQTLIILWSSKIYEHMSILIVVLAGVMLRSSPLYLVLLGSSNGGRNDEVETQLAWLDIFVLLLLKSTWQAVVSTLSFLLYFR